MFTPKFNLGALVMVATNPAIFGTVVGYYHPRADERPQYSVKNKDTLQDTWYYESDLCIAPQTAPPTPPPAYKFKIGQEVLTIFGYIGRVNLIKRDGRRIEYKLEGLPVSQPREYGEHDLFVPLPVKPRWNTMMHVILPNGNTASVSTVEVVGDSYVYNLVGVEAGGGLHRYEESELFASPDEYRKAKIADSLKELRGYYGKGSPLMFVSYHEDDFYRRIIADTFAIKPKESAADKAAREYRESVDEVNKAQEVINQLTKQMREADDVLKAKSENCKAKEREFQKSAGVPDSRYY